LADSDFALYCAHGLISPHAHCQNGINVGGVAYAQSPGQFAGLKQGAVEANEERD
jgi:hypothetical protein